LSSSDVYLSTGINCLDQILGGGFHFGCISLIFGESGTGKTTLATQCAVNYVRDDHSVIYVDSDGMFSLERLSQIVYGDLSSVAPSIIMFSPKTFREQNEIIETLESFISSRTKLVIFDTFSSLYRLELIDRKQTFKLNRQMNRQLAYLAEIARGKEIAVLLTSQVRSILEEEGTRNKGLIEPVATRLLGFWSDLILFLRSTSRPTIKRAELLKPQGSTSASSCLLQLTGNGIEDASGIL
jgi:DNA repair and recombination protein RadB